MWVKAVSLLARLRRLAVYAALACAVLSPSARAGETLNVVFINPGKSGEIFWDMTCEAMRAAAARLDIHLEILTAERNHKKLETLGLEVVARERRPDVLVLVNEESAATPVVEAADRAGLKTFLLSNVFNEAERKRYGAPRTKLVHWIGALEPDIAAAGARMARHLLAAAVDGHGYSADGKIHLLALGGDDQTPNSVARTRGFVDEVAKRPDVRIDRLLYANWNANDARTLTARYLDWADHAGVRPAGVWAANDPMALGAIDALEAKGLSPGKDVGVVGLNWSADALAAIEAGKLLMSDGGHFLGGAYALVLLRDYADGCDFAAADAGAAQTFPLAAIDRSNLDQVKNLIVRREFQRIDFSRFLAGHGGVCGAYDFSLPAVLRAIGPAPGP